MKLAAGWPWRAFKRFAPATRAINRRIAAVAFREQMHRSPLPPHDPDATINDFLFDRMTGRRWSALQIACVDKETAKIEAARLAPAIRIPETKAVVAMAGVRSVDRLYELLSPAIGTATFAKPTHACGGVTAMAQVGRPDDLAGLFRKAKRDYSLVNREMQYRRLPRKAIVEAAVPAPPGEGLDDFKFHCVHGEPLLCQIDHDRFGAMRSRIFRVPDFAPMYPADGIVLPASFRMPPPERIEAMIDAARDLSAPFDFVRIDLYNGADGIYFGEFTFTPGASMGVAPSVSILHGRSPAHIEYSRTIMAAIAAGPR